MKLDLSTVALLHNSPFLALFDWGGKAIGLVDLQILHIGLVDLQILHIGVVDLLSLSIDTS